MEPLCVNNCLAPGWHLLKELIEIGLRDSVPSVDDSLSELIVAPETVIIALLNPILHPVPYHLDWVQIG
jgi:hypothetical protein